MLLRLPLPIILAFCLLCSGILWRAQDDVALDAQPKAIAAAHHGKVTLFAHNLRAGRTAAVMPEQPMQTALSPIIKLVQVVL
jgi:beta-lactamase class A